MGVKVRGSYALGVSSELLNTKNGRAALSLNMKKEIGSP